MLKYVIVSDLQVPYHDPKSVASLAAFIRRFKPDEVLCVGDELDMPQLRKGASQAQEVIEDLGTDRDTCRQVLWDLQVTQLVRSNHQQRLYASISTRLPQLLKLPELEYSRFLGLKELGITFHHNVYNIPHTDWIMIHGDQQSIKPQGGLTAIEAAKRHGKSVVCGHTHRQGLTSVTEASDGRVGRTLSGMEVGHLIDTKSKGMSYTSGTFNWQKGFGVMYVDEKKVYPTLVPMDNDGSFVFNGKRYG